MTVLVQMSNFEPSRTALRMPSGHLFQFAGHPRIVGFDQRHASQKIFFVGIESGGNENHLRLEALQCRQPLRFHGFLDGGAAAARGQGHIDHVGRRIRRTAVGIKRMLKKTRHQRPLVPVGGAEHILGTIAMMHIEVDDRDPLKSLLFQRICCRNPDIVENAEAHGPDLSGMMAARANGAERIG